MTPSRLMLLLTKKNCASRTTMQYDCNKVSDTFVSFEMFKFSEKIPDFDWSFVQLLYLQLLDGIPSDFVSDNYWSMYGESGCFPLWQTGSMVSILTSYYVRFVFCATGNMHALNATGSTYSLYFTSRAFGEEKGKKKPWCPSSENAP